VNNRLDYAIAVILGLAVLLDFAAAGVAFIRGL